MKTVLCISSQSVAGIIGGGVSSFILQTMGHRVWMVPTSLNSNHGGHPHALREPVSDETVEGLITNLEANGWLKDCDAVLTGHFSSVGQVQVAQKWISLLKARNRDLIYCCDPVIGDDAPPEGDLESGGIYVAEDIAIAIRDRLLPLADITSPNRFELEYLSGVAVASPSSAAEAATRLTPGTVLATSIPDGGGLATLVCHGSQVFAQTTPLLPSVPKGTGDAIAALFLGHLLTGHSNAESLEKAVRVIFDICCAGAENGGPNATGELALVENRHLFATSDQV